MLPDRLRSLAAGRSERPRLVSPLFLLVMLSTFAYFVAVGALQPTLPRYVKGPLGQGNFEVGLVVGAFAIAAVLLRPFAGRVSDRHGRRVLIVSGALIVAATIAGFVFVSSVPVLIALRVATGIGEAMFYVGAATVINDIAPDDRRGEALSYFSLALFGGLAVGPVLGEYSLHWDEGFDAAWIVAASAAFLAAVAGLWVRDTRPEDVGVSGRRRIVHPAALEPGTVLATSIWGLATFTSFIPLYALEIGLNGSRFVFVFHSAIVLSVRFFGARIPDRLGPARSARAALTGVAIGLTVMGIWNSVPGVFVGTFVYSLGHSLAFPALMTMAIKNAPPAERGSVVGTFTAFFDLAFGLGAVSAGAIASVLGYRGAFIAAGAVAVAGLALLLARARRRARERAAAAARAEQAA